MRYKISFKSVFVLSPAMQKKPEGESRIPTDIWAGLGFSKSMPESAIREKLGQMGISARYPDASMTPEEYQVCCLFLFESPYSYILLTINCYIYFLGSLADLIDRKFFKKLFVCRYIYIFIYMFQIVR